MDSKWNTPKYRTVGYGSSVDESLFGTGTPTMNGSKRRVTTGPLPASSVVLSPDQLERIKRSTIIKTEAELQMDRERAQAEKEEREKICKERKDRMRQLEKRAVLLAKKSDIELSEIARKEMTKELAEKQIDDSKDAVKLLNSMALRATAFTIRDKQLEEKHRLQKVEEEFDRRTNMMMEIDRIKDLQQREAAELAKRTKRVDDRKVITEQMQARATQKLLSLEAREQENIAMRELMKKYSDEDRIAAERRQKEIEKSRAEVMAANDLAIQKKLEMKEREKKEMEDILIYQAMKDAELAKREEDEAALELIKKERQIKMLAQQEKARDNAGKLDELRARRAMEEKERQARRREKEEAIRKKAEMKELLDSRAKQAADKVEREQQRKRDAEEQIMLQLQYTQKMDEREEREKRIKQERVNTHKTQLSGQIEERRRQRESAPSYLAGGPNIREELLKEEEKVKVIRDKMVGDLVAQGVNPKYLSEMQNVDIGKIIKR